MEEMRKKIVLAGGTGFIGQFLEQKFHESGHEVIIISRKPGHLSWSDQEGIVAALEHSDMVINLAGKSVNCRYSQKNKDEIMNSRTETTNILGKAISACKNPPPLWINSSTATIYRHAQDRPMTEANGEIGTGFSVDVAKAWEQSLFSFQLAKTRQVALRISIVLGESGGVMKPFLNLVRLGLGGKQGPGSQMFSWIHIEDLYRVILFIQGKPHLSGVFNCAAPKPVTNRELMAQVRTSMNRRIGLASPIWLLEMGAVVIRTETELILKSRWVLPERLMKSGFEFTYPTLGSALEEIALHSK